VKLGLNHAGPKGGTAEAVAAKLDVIELRA